jgi:hypothetical protein
VALSQQEALAGDSARRWIVALIQPPIIFFGRAVRLVWDVVTRGRKRRAACLRPPLRPASTAWCLQCGLAVKARRPALRHFVFDFRWERSEARDRWRGKSARPAAVSEILSERSRRPRSPKIRVLVAPLLRSGKVPAGQRWAMLDAFV